MIMHVLDLIKEYWPFGILIVAVAIFWIYSVRIKGFIGEKSIAIRLNRLNPNKYFIINNLVLEVNGKTSQIDHVVISDFGIFVIETKNYKGWIMGGEHSDYWTQLIFKRKERFYNPIRQNRGHIVALKQCLPEFSKVSYVPIVVFSTDADIKVDTDSLVIYSSQLTNGIRGYSDIRLSTAEKETIFEKINSLNVSHTYKRSAHIKSIKHRINKQQISIEQNKCPRCGGELVSRSGKYGRFFGCGNFPQCRFTTD